MVIPSFVGQALAGRPLTVYGDGRQIRCFCHVHDVVRALADLMEREDLYGEIFNIGSQAEIRGENLRQLRLQLNPAFARRNVERFVHLRAVDKRLDVPAVADHVQPRPLAVRAVLILRAAEAFLILPIRVAAVPIDALQIAALETSRAVRPLSKSLRSSRSRPTLHV